MWLFFGVLMLGFSVIVEDDVLIVDGELEDVCWFMVEEVGVVLVCDVYDDGEGICLLLLIFILCSLIEYWYW